MLTFSSTCQQNVAQGDLGCPHVEDGGALASRTLPFTAYSLSACLHWDICTKTIEI